jgi:hypothetical protein
MFLIPLDSSDFATPDGTGSFFKNKVDFMSNFPVSESRLRERPQLILLTRCSSYLLLFLSHTQLKYYYIIKTELRGVSCSPNLLTRRSSNSCGRSLSLL